MEAHWRPTQTSDERLVETALGGDASAFGTLVERHWKTVVAIALSRIADMPGQTDGVLGIGSDDGVKVWLNRQLVHENWTTRGAEPDSDRVPVTFRKGRNQLVLKIQNAGGPWGFACRLLEK
jgi:hypothetical protein